MMLGCQGKDKTPTIQEKKCPKCGNLIEVFSIDTDAVCEKCGTKIYNDTLNCVQWCTYAKQCVGEEMYDQLMEVAAKQKERRDEEKKLQQAG